MELIDSLLGHKKDGEIVLVVDNRSLADRIVEMIKSYDFEPKFKIKRIRGFPCIPWISLDGDCYVVNASREYKGMSDDESFAFQVILKGFRLRAQRDNPKLVLFTEEFHTGNPIIDEKIGDICFSNSKKENIDAEIFALVVVSTFYLEDYPFEEIAKIIGIGADELLKLQIDPKKKKILR